MKYYDELRLIREDFKSNFAGLIHDYEQPLKDSYSGVPRVDFYILDGLYAELIKENAIENSNHRDLITRFKNLSVKISNLNDERDLIISSWMKEGTSFNIDMKISASTSIKHNSAVIVYDVMQSIFYLSKLMEEKDNFIFISSHKELDKAKAVCVISDIEFVPNTWSGVLGIALPNGVV